MSHIDHQAQPSTTGLTCRWGDCWRPQLRRGWCGHHARAADHYDELTFFEGWHASDERLAEWLGITVNGVLRLRERRQRARQ